MSPTSYAIDVYLNDPVRVEVLEQLTEALGEELNFDRCVPSPNPADPLTWAQGIAPKECFVSFHGIDTLTDTGLDVWAEKIRNRIWFVVAHYVQVNIQLYEVSEESLDYSYQDLAEYLEWRTEVDRELNQRNEQAIGKQMDSMLVCDGCDGGCLPGVLFPSHPNDSNEHQWVERCDACRIFPSDEAAAVFLARCLGKRIGYAKFHPDFSARPYIVGMTEEEAEKVQFYKRVKKEVSDAEAPV